MPRVSFAALAAFAALFWPATAGAQSASPRGVREIRPGQSIGVLRLGMTRDQAVRAMGRPGESRRVGANLHELRWFVGKIEREDQEIPHLSAWIRDGRVAQLEVASTLFATSAGIGLNTSLGRLRQAYPDLRRIAYSLPGGGGAQYYAPPRAGICFHFATLDPIEESDQPDSVIVYSAGSEPLAPPGARRMRGQPPSLTPPK